MSKPKLNIKEESSTKKTRSPPKKAKVEQPVQSSHSYTVTSDSYPLLLRCFFRQITRSSF